MTLMRCLDCGTLFAVGLHYCPQCTSEKAEEDGMPKITRHGGFSDASSSSAEATGEVPREVGPPPAAPAGPETDTPDDGEEEAEDVASDEDEPAEAGPADPVAVTRPSVNDPKSTWVTYFAATYRVDPDGVDDRYSKRGIVDAVAKLEAGTHLLGEDGDLVDVTPLG